MLTAMIEEAQYRILMSREGKTLVQARYSVRNNQRNFAKIALPAGATLWWASQGGRPVRPGKSAEGALLFPLEKGRAGEDARAFGIELVYMARGDLWTDRGKASLVLPAADLPVSRTGVLVYYPPVYKVTPEAGPFRTASSGSEPEIGNPPAIFPVVGPSLYLAAELTGENQTPKVELNYQKERRGGAR
jgi:hypothetical protein